MTDRRRNESAWKKRRFRLLPSSAYRHFTLITTETASPPPPSMRTLQVEWTMALFSTAPPPKKNTHSHTQHTHSHTYSRPVKLWCLRWEAGPGALASVTWWLADLVEPMRCNCFLRKCASVMRTGAYEDTHTHTHKHTLFCFHADHLYQWLVSQTHTHAHTHTHTRSHKVLWMYDMPWGNAI